MAARKAVQGGAEGAAKAAAKASGKGAAKGAAKGTAAKLAFGLARGSAAGLVTAAAQSAAQSAAFARCKAPGLSASASAPWSPQIRGACRGLLERDLLHGACSTSCKAFGDAASPNLRVVALLESESDSDSDDESDSDSDDEPGHGNMVSVGWLFKNVPHMLLSDQMAGETLQMQ